MIASRLPPYLLTKARFRRGSRQLHVLRGHYRLTQPLWAPHIPECYVRDGSTLPDGFERLAADPRLSIIQTHPCTRTHLSLAVRTIFPWHLLRPQLAPRGGSRQIKRFIEQLENNQRKILTLQLMLLRISSLRSIFSTTVGPTGHYSLTGRGTVFWPLPDTAHIRRETTKKLLTPSSAPTLCHDLLFAGLQNFSLASKCSGIESRMVNVRLYSVVRLRFRPSV
jgi:hypothetical protein